MATNTIETDELPGIAPGSSPNDKSITLSERELEALLQRAAAGGRKLPPGAFYDESGEVKRKVPVGTGRIRTRPDGRRVRVYQAREHKVIIPADTSIKAFREARRTAIQEAADIYHPTAGWLQWGYYKEVDHPENLGNGVREYETWEEEIEEPAADAGSTTVTAIGTEKPQAATGQSRPSSSRRSRSTPRQEIPAGLEDDDEEASDGAGS